MKKKISILLMACIIVGLLTGCFKSNWQKYQEAVASLNNNDLKFRTELTLEGDNAFTREYLDSEKVTLIVDGSMSAKSVMAEMSVSINIPSVNTTVELTDIIIDEDKMYINAQKLFTLFVEDTDAAEYMEETLMNGKSYICIDTREYLNTDKSQTTDDEGFTSGITSIYENIYQNNDVVTAKYTAETLTNEKSNILMDMDEDANAEKALDNMITNIMGIYDTVIQNHDAVSKDGNTYTVNLDGSAIEELVLGVIEYIQDNKETFYDLSIQIYSDDILESTGLTMEEVEDLREENLVIIDNMLVELKDSIDAKDFSNTSYTSKVDDKSQELTLIFNAYDELNFKYSYTAEKTDIGSIQVPEEYITMSEFVDIINSLEYTDFGDTASSDNDEFSFNVKYADTNPQIIDPDLSGYTYLTNYSFKSDISGEVFNVPVIDGELYGGTGSIYSYTENSELYISYYSWYMSDEEFLTYCEDYFCDEYNYYGEYGYKACYSDAYVSADGNTVVMALAYDYGYDSVYTDIYMFHCINEEEMLYGQVSVNNEYIDTTESAILSEYGQLLGVDFMQFLNLF